MCVVSRPRITQNMKIILNKKIQQHEKHPLHRLLCLLFWRISGLDKKKDNVNTILLRHNENIVLLFLAGVDDERTNPPYLSVSNESLYCFIRKGVKDVVR